MTDTRTRAGLRIPYDLNTWLILEARKQGISKNAYILKILWEHLEKEEKGDNSNDRTNRI